MKKYGHKSKESAFNGVWLYLETHYYFLVKGGNTDQQFKKARILCTDFLKEHNIISKGNRTDAIQVQKEWILFKEWISKK